MGNIDLEVVTNELGMEQVVMRKLRIHDSKILHIFDVYEFDRMIETYKSKLKEFRKTPLLKEFLDEKNGRNRKKE